MDSILSNNIKKFRLWQDSEEDEEEHFAKELGDAPGEDALVVLEQLKYHVAVFAFNQLKLLIYVALTRIRKHPTRLCNRSWYSCY